MLPSVFVTSLRELIQFNQIHDLFFYLLLLQRSSIYANVDAALHKIRETSEVPIISKFDHSLLLFLVFIVFTYMSQNSYLFKYFSYFFFQVKIKLMSIFVQAVQSFASEHLKTPLGEPVKGKQNKSSADLWLEKFYKKVTNLPEPFPHELVERLEQYLDVSKVTFTLLTFEHLY